MEHFTFVPDAGVDAGWIQYRNGKRLCYVYKEVDGYYVACEFGDGAWEPWALRGIADRLDEMNREWDEEVSAYFRSAVENPVSKTE